MKVHWTLPTTYTDGSAFGQSDYAGVELSLDDAPAVSLPAAWNPNNRYEFVLDTLHPAEGPHTLELRTVAANGEVSDWSAAVPFVYKKKPQAPVVGGIE